MSSKSEKTWDLYVSVYKRAMKADQEIYYDRTGVCRVHEGVTDHEEI